MATDATVVSFGFQVQLGGYAGGWSENWWNTLDPGDALTAAIAVIPKLMAIHGNLARLVNISCRSTDRTKQSASYQVGDPTIGPNVIPAGPPVPGTAGIVDYFGTAGEMDFATTALLLESFQNSGGEATRVWVRGIPDARVEDGEYSPSGNYTARITQFGQALKSNNFVMFKSVRAGARTVLADVDQGLGIFNSVGHGLAVGQRIRVLRGKGIRGLNRSWKVMAVLDANNFSVQDWNPAKYAGSYVVGSGSWKLYAKQSISMDGVRVVRATKHNIGRGPALLRGRKRTKRYPVQGR